MDIHNQMRDAMHCVLAELGSHAGITHSRRDIVSEPVNVVHAFPDRRPADVLINLRSSYARPPLVPFARAAVDVTISSPLPLLPLGGAQSHYTASVTKHHQDAERSKFRSTNSSRRTSTQVAGSQVVAALNDSNTVLLPVVFDPLGGYGPIASRFLFGTLPDPAPDPLTFTSAASQLAYNNATSDNCPVALLPHADKAWLHNNPYFSFGSTYHSWFPSTWARQILGLNFMHAAAQHIHRRLNAMPTSAFSPADYEYPLALGQHSRFRITVPHSETRRRVTAGTRA